MEKAKQNLDSAPQSRIDQPRKERQRAQIMGLLSPICTQKYLKSTYYPSRYPINSSIRHTFSVDEYPIKMTPPEPEFSF